MTWLGSWAFAYLAVCAGVFAQGHCELRAPETSVFRGFPEADGYRAIVRDVGDDVRLVIDTKLPFPVHFNEIGKHTLYVALRGRRPIGFVHSRSEEGRWGLVEIVWYFELDMRVKRFWFQRLRDRRGNALARSPFAERLIGRDFERMGALLTPVGELAPAVLPLPKGTEDLARTVVRSALKTIIVTRAAWQTQIEGLTDLALGIDMFPAAHATGRLAEMTAKKPSKPIANAPAPNTEPAPSARPAIRSLYAIRVLGEQGANLGRAVRTSLRVLGTDLDLRWAVGKDGRIQKIVCEPRWPSEKIAVRFRELEGRIISALTASGEVSRLAAQVVEEVQSLVPARKR